MMMATCKPGKRDLREVLCSIKHILQKKPPLG